MGIQHIDYLREIGERPGKAVDLETQEMVFDAHDRAFAFFKGACRRGIYDNMKTAVQTIFAGKAHHHPELTDHAIWEVFEAERAQLVRSSRLC